jgi:hypothetical protein
MLEKPHFFALSMCYLQASETCIGDVGAQDGEDIGQKREQGAKRRSKLKALVPR